MKKHKTKKARNLIVTTEFLKSRADRCVGAGYKKQQWVSFCEIMLSKGFTCTIYEAKETYSKYVTVGDGKHHTFKIRFSNHKPILQRELNGDCDFFVGISHTGVSTTAQAVLSVMRFFDSVSHG